MDTCDIRAKWTQRLARWPLSLEFFHMLFGSDAAQHTRLLDWLLRHWEVAPRGWAQMRAYVRTRAVVLYWLG